MRTVGVTNPLTRSAPLSLPVQDVLTACASRYPEVERVILFGSRARGDARDRSDFDLAVDAPDITHGRWSKFAIELEEQIPSLCRIDLVRLSKNTPPVLQAQIRQQGIVIYDHAA
mgnify:CR=1 FL=1